MSKLVKKAAEHADRKAQKTYTYETVQVFKAPTRLDDRTVNKIIGFCVFITVMSIVAMFAAIMRCG